MSHVFSIATFPCVDHHHPTHTEPLDTTFIPHGKRSVFMSSTALFCWETAGQAAAGGGGDINEMMVAALLSVNMSDGKGCGLLQELCLRRFKKRERHLLEGTESSTQSWTIYLYLFSYSRDLREQENYEALHIDGR